MDLIKFILLFIFRLIITLIESKDLSFGLFFYLLFVEIYEKIFTISFMRRKWNFNFFSPEIKQTINLINK